MLEVQEILELEKKWKAYDKKRANPISKEKTHYNYLLVALLAASVTTASLVFFYLEEPKMKVAATSTNSTTQEVRQSFVTKEPNINSSYTTTTKEPESLSEELPSGTLLNQNYNNFANNENSIETEKQDITSLAQMNSQQNQQGWIYLNEDAQASFEAKASGEVEIQELRKQVLFTAPNEEAINLEADTQSIQNSIMAEKDEDNSFKIQIQSSGPEISVDELKSKFDRTNSSELATLIAKKYYDIQDYKSSEKWSVIANELNSDNEESWVIFAKSKYNLGQKYDAVRVLKIYNEKANSKEIETLIKHIENSSI
ncbi:transformation system protein [Campylobacter sp. MOP51]|uniref:transformation system protein n=1 Tax=Campylobacter canis TaxID=3378588 RepID=UPI003C5F5178